VLRVFFFYLHPIQNIKENSPDEVAQSLINMLSNDSVPPHIKDLSAVLLRGLISGYDSAWAKMSPASQNLMKESLVAFVTRGIK
jgi:hypothetical protein